MTGGFRPGSGNAVHFTVTGLLPIIPRSSSTSMYHAVAFPGAAKYGDIETLLRLAPNKMWSVDDRGLPAWLR